MKLKILILFLVELQKFSLAAEFEDITSDVFPVGEDLGVIAAFGHFNSDEYTDIVTLQQCEKKLQLLKGSESTPYFQPSSNCSFGSEIINVVPSDFNGDSVMDVLVILSRGSRWNETTTDAKILWGFNRTIDCKSDTSFVFKGQPFVIDFNGDMLPDVIGENLEGERIIWISSRNKTFINRTLTSNTHPRIKYPHSSGLIDINDDLIPDLLITGESYIETWYNNKGKKFVENASTSIPYPSKSKYQYHWQSTFIDLNLNGHLDHVIPVCVDYRCRQSAILIWNQNISEWETLLDNFRNPTDGSNWGFKLQLGKSVMDKAFPVTLRAGDFNMDGYPDFIVVLQSKDKATDVRAFILKNVPCTDCSFGRSIQVEWDVPGLKDISNVRVAAFFDLFEDGTLDILVSSQTNEEWKIHALRNMEVFDSCFLKVLVLNGLCPHHNCPQNPYGLNQPGPMVRYNMTTGEGQPLSSTAVQLSQSAYFPLQLPYSLFGLGPTPNFIDVLTVSVPYKFADEAHKRDWVQIIPNSQIVVIPHPPHDEKKWVRKLYVTPSHLVLMTCISLIGTCIFISLLVAILHWKEKREDKKEKMQDAYRFHFDAM